MPRWALALFGCQRWPRPRRNARVPSYFLTATKACGLRRRSQLSLALELLTGADFALLAGVLVPPLLALTWSIANPAPVVRTGIANLAAPVSAVSVTAAPHSELAPSGVAKNMPLPVAELLASTPARVLDDVRTTAHPQSSLSVSDAPRQALAMLHDAPTVLARDVAVGSIRRFGRCALDEPSITRLDAVGPDAPFGVRLAQAAESQLDDFVVYTDSYKDVPFPMGDVPPLYGVCTDVVIRAYRAIGIDLQGLVHASRVGSGDASIDHRRTDVLRRFFEAQVASQPISDVADDYLPGDIVTYYRPQNYGSQNHIAIVSSQVARSGRPMIVHNRGWGPQLEDALFVDQITGHYRYSGPPAGGPFMQTSSAALIPRYAKATASKSSSSSYGSPGSSVILKSRRMRAALIRQRIDASRARVSKARERFGKARAERKTGAIVR